MSIELELQNLKNELQNKEELIGKLIAENENLSKNNVIFEKQYFDLLNHINGIIWEADAQTFEFKFVSKQAETILGYKIKEWLESPKFWVEHIHPEDREFAVNFCIYSTQQNIDHEFKYRMIAADGRIVWLHDVITVISENGKAKTLKGVMIDITTQKVAEEELKINQEKYKNIIHVLQEGIVIQDVNGVIIDSNTSASEILGLTPEQMNGTTTIDPIWRTIKEDGTPFNGEIHPISLSLKEGKVSSGVIMGVYKPNNELTWISINSKPLYNQNTNEIIGAVASFKDVTQQKSKEEVLNRNIQLLEESQSIGKLGGWELDLITGDLYWTAETYRIHETSPEEFNPTVDAGVGYFLPESREIISKALELAISKGEGYDLYLQTYTTKGSLIDVRTTCKVTMIDEKPIKLTGIFQDITEPKRKEKEILDRKNHFKTLVEHSPFCIHELNLEGKLVSMNPAGLSMMEVESESEIINFPYLNVVSDNDRSRIEQLLQKAINNETQKFEFSSNSGNIFKSNFIPIPDENGNVVRLMGITEDITEQRKAEKKILEEQERLQTIMQAISIPIFVKDSEHKILHANQAFYNLFGLEEKYVIGKTLAEHVSENEREQFLAIDNKVLETGIPDFREETLTLDGFTRTILTSKVRFIENTGKRLLVGSIFDITERKKAEEELKASDEKYKLLFDNNPLPISVFDVETLKFLNVNEAFCQKYGYTKEELLNLTILAIRPEEEYDVVQKSVHNHDTGVVNVGVYTHKKRNGELIKVEIIRHEIFYEGKLAKLVLANDVTEKLKAEEELILNQKAVESSYEGIIIADATKDDNPTIYINERFTLITGYTKDDIYGKNCRILQGPNTAGETLEKLRNSLKEKTEFEGELLNYRKDGTTFWNYLRIRTIKNNNGVVTHFVGFQSDITERKLSEIMLIEREKSLEDIFNFSPVPFVISNIETGQIIMINESLSKLVGGKKSDLVGRHTSEFYSTKIDRSLILKEIEETGGLINKEFILKTLNGKEIDCLTSATRIVLNNQTVNLISMLDISSLKETEAALIKAKESAEEMNRLKSSFLANMSHELRTPMNGILGFSDYLTTLNNVDEMLEIGELVHSSAKRLMDTLNLILDISTIESGVNKITIQEIDIIEDINQYVILFSKMASAKNLYLNIDTNFDNLTILSNKQAIYSIFTNLINNAIKFTNNGGITINIDTLIEENVDENENTNNWVLVSVADTGIGIDKKHQSIIFEEFRQVSEGTSRSFEGTGLGLTLTKKYVELLGGNIYVESTLGKGTKFTVKLPIDATFVVNKQNKNIDLKTNNDKQVNSNFDVKYLSNHKKSILVVEDDYASLKLITYILKDLYMVDEALKPEEAIELALNNNYDLIITDINLGRGHNGLYVTSELRKTEKYKNTTIIAMTAYAISGDKEEFLEAGCTDYISKPIDRLEFLALLEKYLKN